MNRPPQHRAALILYRLSLRLYPREFRERFAHSMLEDLDQLLRTESARRGRMGVVSAWRRALIDLWRSAIRERVSARGAAAADARRRGGSSSSLFSDLRYATRGLTRARGFAVAATLTLAFGIGANTAIFALINAVLLRPLPYADPGQLVRIHQHDTRREDARAWIAPAFYKDVEAQQEVFESIAAWFPSATTVSGPEGEAEYVLTAAVTPSFFDVLGVPALLGRTFREEDAQPGNRRVVLGERYWRARFGAAPDIIGRTMTRSRVDYEIIGVMPQSIDLPRQAEMWVPITSSPGRWENRGSHYLRAVARLAPGTDVAAARANLETIARRAAEQHAEQVGWSTSVFPFREDLTHEVRPALLLLQGAVFVVLLIACVNVANLQLARGSARAGEFALRTALGASRGRIAQQVLVEGLLLASIGAAAGVGVAMILVRTLAGIAPSDALDPGAVTFDPIVIGFTVVVALGTGIVFSISPALRSAPRSASAVLRDVTHRSGGPSRRIRDLLVATEVALSLLLVAGAALLLTSFARLIGVDTGIAHQQVLTARVAIPASVYEEPIDRARFFRELHDAAGQVAGVESASLVSDLPLTGMASYWGNGFHRPDLPHSPPGQDPVAMLRWISPGYLETVGMPLLRGRSFTYADTEDSPNVMLIDQTMAERHFPGEDPIGKRVVIHYNDFEAEIIGVVGNARQARLDEPLEPHMYVSYWQTYTPMFLSSMTVVLHTAGNPQNVVTPFRAAVARLDPLVVPTSIETFEDRLAGSVATRRFSLLLVAVFAILAASLAAVGLYGVIAYLVSQRTREIGIRVALGAQRRTVIYLVLRHGLTITAAGMAIGIIGLIATQSLLARFLFRVNATDPLTIGLVCLLLVGIALAATLAPAHRAARLDPVRALR